MRCCIYLKGTEPVLSFNSQEHIFPAGIGGIQMLPKGYVSDQFNNSFSKIELDFMRNSLIALPRQFYGQEKEGLYHKKGNKIKGIYHTKYCQPKGYNIRLYKSWATL